jgi:hypothetical protein
MALKYFTEFVKDNDSGLEESVFIHLTRDVPVYQSRLSKEEWVANGSYPAFINGLFVDGVTDVQSTSYRVLVSKSPIYQWEDILDDVLSFLITYFGETVGEEQPNSGRTLDDVKTRRNLD